MADQDIIARLADSVGALDAAQWDACAGSDNPFLSHAFLTILEESGSVGGRSGWQPTPIVITGEDGT
ncbi:peptidogalycan biosysnthesis protein, partial [Acinetobacter baumannii]